MKISNLTVVTYDCGDDDHNARNDVGGGRRLMMMMIMTMIMIMVMIMIEIMMMMMIMINMFAMMLGGGGRLIIIYPTGH